VVTGKNILIMRELVIEVGMIEEWQTLNDVNELERVFEKARSTIVNGEKVILARKQKKGGIDKFDELTTLDDLEEYRKRVYMYL